MHASVCAGVGYGRRELDMDVDDGSGSDVDESEDHYVYGTTRAAQWAHCSIPS